MHLLKDDYKNNYQQSSENDAIELTEIEKAILDGYTRELAFVDGNIIDVLEPSTFYSIISSEKRPFPCLKTLKTVYRIQIGNIKGYAQIGWDNDETFF